MQNLLDLKTHKIPADFSDDAKVMCRDLVNEIDRTHEFYKEQMELMKQKFKIALKSARPDFVTPETLGLLFDEVETTLDEEIDLEVEEPTNKKKEKKKRKKKKKAIPDHLPRTIVEHDLPEDEKVCATDGSALSPMGFDSKEELKFTPAKFEVIEHRYPKYSCKTCQTGVKREEASTSLLPGSYASNELLAHIAVSKFCNHLPLYRQSQIFSREGINISRQVMADWMIKLGEALNPLLGIMHEKILEAEVVHADETPVRVLTKGGIRTSKLSYMWQLSRWGSHPLILFEYDGSRKKEVAERLLGSFEGFIQIDGYAGYDILFDEPSPRTRVGCMAHVLRKFKDFLSALPKDKRAKHESTKIIGLIRKLYKIEEDLRSKSYAERHAARRASKAGNMFEQLEDIVALEKESVSKQSPYYAALRYAHEELPYIKNYLRNGQIELDNNLAENAIRPFALGRRNWLFMCTENGAKASANIFSLLTTAKANNLEPYSYLLSVIQRLPYCLTAEDYEQLLPA